MTVCTNWVLSSWRVLFTNLESKQISFFNYLWIFDNIYHASQSCSLTWRACLPKRLEKSFLESFNIGLDVFSTKVRFIATNLFKDTVRPLLDRVIFVANVFTTHWMNLSTKCEYVDLKMKQKLIYATFVSLSSSRYWTIPLSNSQQESLTKKVVFSSSNFVTHLSNISCKSGLSARVKYNLMVSKTDILRLRASGPLCSVVYKLNRIGRKFLAKREISCWSSGSLHLRINCLSEAFSRKKNLKIFLLYSLSFWFLPWCLFSAHFCCAIVLLEFLLIL